MTPGRLADEALSLLHWCAGELGGMVVRKELSRVRLDAVLRKLDRAAILIAKATEG